MARRHRRVLDYHDVLLYDTDVDLLKGPEWLNDQAGQLLLTLNGNSFVKRHFLLTFVCRVLRGSQQIITFYFEYLQNEHLSARPEILLVGGALTYLMLHTGQTSLRQDLLESACVKFLHLCTWRDQGINVVQAMPQI
jgi:hypothetical protein